MRRHPSSLRISTIRCFCSKDTLFQVPIHCHWRTQIFAILLRNLCNNQERTNGNQLSSWPTHRSNRISGRHCSEQSNNRCQLEYSFLCRPSKPLKATCLRTSWINKPFCFPKHSSSDRALAPNRLHLTQTDSNNENSNTNPETAAILNSKQQTEFKLTSRRANRTPQVRVINQHIQQ